MRRSPIPAAMLALLLLVACAGTLVVRAPQEIPPHTESVLAQIAPLAIALSPATGAAAAADLLGERAGGWGRQGGAITSTERPGDLVRRVVAQELEQAGHRIVEHDPDVVLGVSVMEFTVDAPRVGRGWDVTVAIRAALRVEREPGSDDWSEFVYSTESTGRTLAPPGLSIVERILGEAVRRVAALVAERDALAAALQQHARAAG
jgi:hypothetical protein